MIWLTYPPGGGAGLVSSFNGRTGAVTLLESDVIDALGYTPVNRAGDTMTGPLSNDSVSNGSSTINGSDISGEINGGDETFDLATSGLSFSILTDTWNLNTAGPSGMTTSGSLPLIFGTPTRLTVAPTDPDDLVRLQDIGGGGGVTSFNTRTGAVTLLEADVTAAVGQALDTGADVEFSSVTAVNDMGITSGAGAFFLDGQPFFETDNDGQVYLQPIGAGQNILFRNFAQDQQIAFLTDTGDFGNTGFMFTGAHNLGGEDLSPFYNQVADYQVLIGFNRTGANGEIDFISIEGTVPLTNPGFNFITVANDGTEVVLFGANSFGFVTDGPIAPGVVEATSDISTLFLTIDPTVKTIVSRTVAETSLDLGIRAGGIDVDMALGQTQIVVPVPVQDMPDGNYAVVVTPTNAAAATAILTGYYINGKIDASFNLNFLVAPGLVEVTFDFHIIANS